MIEHAALRLHFRFARETNSDTIYEVEEFVRNCHAKIEDDIVFPNVKVSLDSPSNAKLVQVILRLEADHKLIDTIANQIRLRTAQGDVETLRKRILLYMNTVESHNSSEESLIFQYLERQRVGRARRGIKSKKNHPRIWIEQVFYDNRNF